MEEPTVGVRVAETDAFHLVEMKAFIVLLVKNGAKNLVTSAMWLKRHLSSVLRRRLRNVL